jgi:hypothetical protein
LVSTLAVLDAGDGRREAVNVEKGSQHDSIAWLPDGSGIVRSGQNFGTSVSRQLSIVSYPGGKVRRLTNDASDYRQVTVSAGDAAIAAVRVNRVANLWLADATGGEARAITKFTNPENSPVGFVTSFDGSIVYVAARDQSLQLWAIGAEGGEARALTGGDGFVVNPRAFRGGVAYNRIAPGGGISVWRVDLDGTKVKNLTPNAPAQIVDVARDGSFVTYLQLDGAAETWAMPVNGGAPKSLGPKISGGPFSPDGTQVVGFQLTTGTDGLVRFTLKLFRADGTPTDVNLEIPQRDANTLALCYNADMFRAKGLDPASPPKTWSELTTDAAKLKDPAKNVFGFGFSAMQAEEGVFQWLPFLYQAGGSIDHLDAPEAAESLQLLVDFVKSGVASLDVLNQRQYEVTNTFMAGNTAMVMCGPWELPRLRNEAKGRVCTRSRIHSATSGQSPRTSRT